MEGVGVSPSMARSHSDHHPKPGKNPLSYRPIEFTSCLCIIGNEQADTSALSAIILLEVLLSDMKSVISRRKQRSAFDQVSEFDRRRIESYRDCGLSFREIGSPVGRNQTNVMRICDCWMQEGTTDRRGQSHPPQCTTSREDRQIVRMAVTDRPLTSRNVAQHIESITHHSVSARTIRRRLLQSGLSARRPLLGLPLTQSHRRLRRQWCDERRMWAA
ncbi:transposable element Tcb1 transposase [Trichonephila clavipes]|uniref:Transposable element Tcb1 transposase n=1 Tax=Trichonephila clavipes TaxID=2585209 RepID=A0A8X6W7V0_TRICX|nr:transposable element Tcb1 transposase [Trichonephila clavipes]